MASPSSSWHHPTHTGIFPYYRKCQNLSADDLLPVVRAQACMRLGFRRSRFTVESFQMRLGPNRCCACPLSMVFLTLSVFSTCLLVYVCTFRGVWYSSSIRFSCLHHFVSACDPFSLSFRNDNRFAYRHSSLLLVGDAPLVSIYTGEELLRK